MPGNGPWPCGRHSIACRVADPLWMSTVSGPPDVWPQAVATVSVRTSGTRTNAYSFVICQSLITGYHVCHLLCRNGPNSFSQVVFENDTTFHHEFYFLKFRNIFEGVAAHCHKIRPLPGFDGSSSVTPAKQFRGNRSSRSNRLHWCHAVLDVIFEFLGLINFFPVESACVRTQGNLDSLVDGLGKVGLLQIESLLPKLVPPLLAQ